MNEPTFSERSQLVRYISEENRLKNRRPAVAAFLDAPSATPDKDYLSVNSLEIDSMNVIAAYHRSLWQNNRGRVALTVHNVAHYTDVGRKCGIDIRYERSRSKWMFRHGARHQEAYKHHPNLRSDRPISRSHSGVEFVRALNQHGKDKFARRMVIKRFHLF